MVPSRPHQHPHALPADLACGRLFSSWADAAPRHELLPPLHTDKLQRVRGNSGQSGSPPLPSGPFTDATPSTGRVPNQGLHRRPTTTQSNARPRHRYTPPRHLNGALTNRGRVNIPPASKEESPPLQLAISPTMASASGTTPHPLVTKSAVVMHSAWLSSCDISNGCRFGASAS